MTQSERDILATLIRAQGSDIATLLERTKDLPRTTQTVSMLKGALILLAAMVPTCAGVVTAVLKS